MDNKKNDFYYIRKIQDSMMFRLIQISENSKKLSDNFKKSMVRFHGWQTTVSGIESYMIMAV